MLTKAYTMYIVIDTKMKNKTKLSFEFKAEGIISYNPQTSHMTIRLMPVMKSAVVDQNSTAYCLGVKILTFFLLQFVPVLLPLFCYNTNQ